jgi:signal transduction histidine kinase
MRLSSNFPAFTGFRRKYLHSIAKLHLVGYVIVLVMLLIAGGAAVIGISAVRANYTHTVTVTDVLANLVVTQVRYIADEETSLRGYLLTRDRAYLAPYTAAEAAIPAARVRINTLADAEVGAQPLIRPFIAAAERWQIWAKQVLAQPPKTGAALLAQQATGKALFDKSRTLYTTAVTFLVGVRTSVHNQSDAVMTRTLWIVGILMAAAVLVMVMVGWLVSKAVTNPLQLLGEAAARVGEGELDEPVSVTGTVEFETMALHMDRMRLRLHDLIAQLRGVNTELSGRSAQLLAANEELEAFSYSVSHDLRSPLRAIDGFSRIVLDDYAEVLPPEGVRYLGIVCDNAAQMGRLIDDLLSFSQLTRQSFVCRDVDMGALVRKVVADLSLIDRGARVEIGDIPPCLGDPILLRQVLINLIGNAFKYSSKRAEPSVSVGYYLEAGECVYWVRDNGVGFDMRYASKLFGVFQRLHRVEDFEGTGVGLAIVQRILNRHAGRVWAESMVNEGATFFFTVHGERAA